MSLPTWDDVSRKHNPGLVGQPDGLRHAVGP